MHFTRFTPLALVLIAFSIIGCSSSSRTQKSINFTKVYVEAPQTSDSSSNVVQFNSTVVETAEGELRSRGYTVTSSKADADATLRSTWHISNNGNAIHKDEVSVSLSMSLFNKKGQKVFSADSGSSVPISFWSMAKTSTAVDTVLSQLPVVTPSAK
jgi:predicted Zn-dependent protease